MAIIPGVATLGFMTCGTFDWGGTQLIDLALRLYRRGWPRDPGRRPSWRRSCGTTLLADPRVKPIGLGARDSLRLEAGLPLYGHDLDETVSPTEAGLNFAVSKRRREAADFPGAARILREFAGELDPHPRRPASSRARRRARAPTSSTRTASAIGRVTRGGFSPSLGRAIALGFVPPASPRPAPTAVSVRGRAAGRRSHARCPSSPTAISASPPEDRMTTRFTKDHEYIRVDGTTGVVGITNYAQDQLGDIVFVELPSVGKKLKQGDEAAVVEVGQGRVRNLLRRPRAR